MKLKNKVIPILLCSALLGSAELSSFSELINNNVVQKHNNVVKADTKWKIPSDALHTGKSGEVEWYINKDKELHFHEGQMANMLRPAGDVGYFDQYKNDIEHIYFDGHVSFGPAAIDTFHGLINLKTFSFKNTDFSQTGDMSNFLMGPNKLTSIDIKGMNFPNVVGFGNVFSESPTLQSVDMSDTNFPKLEHFDNVFANDVSLTTVHMSSNTPNVTWIAGFFRNCKSLEYADFSMLDTTKMSPDDPYNPYAGTHDFVTGADKLWQIKTGPKFKKDFTFPNSDGLKWAYVGNGTMDKPEGQADLTKYDGTKPGTYVKVDPSIVSVNAIVKSNIGDILVPARGKIGTTVKAKAQVKDPNYTTLDGDTPTVEVKLEGNGKYSIDNPNSYRGGKLFYYPKDGYDLGEDFEPISMDNDIVKGSKIDENTGNAVSDANYKYTKNYIELFNGSIDLMSGILPDNENMHTGDMKTYVSFYDENEKYISSSKIFDKNTGTSSDMIYTQIPNNAKYFRYSYPKIQDDYSFTVGIHYNVGPWASLSGDSGYYVSKDKVLTMFDGTLKSSTFDKSDITSAVYGDYVTAIDFSKADGKVYMDESAKLFSYFENLKAINLTNLSLDKVPNKTMELPKFSNGDVWVTDKGEVVEKLDKERTGWIRRMSNPDRPLINHETGQEVEKVPDNLIDNSKKPSGGLSIDYLPEFDFGVQDLNFDGKYKLDTNLNSLIQVTRQKKTKYKLSVKSTGFGNSGLMMGIGKMNVNSFDKDHKKLNSVDKNDLSLTPNDNVDIYTGAENSDYQVDSMKFDGVYLKGNNVQPGEYSSTLTWSLSNAD